MSLPHALGAPQGCVAALPTAARSPLSRARHAAGGGDQGGMDAAAGMQPSRPTRQPRNGSAA